MEIKKKKYQYTLLIKLHTRKPNVCIHRVNKENNDMKQNEDDASKWLLFIVAVAWFFECTGGRHFASII